MAKPKRTPLAFNTNELTDELKESAGRGVNATRARRVQEQQGGDDRSEPDAFVAWTGSEARHGILSSGTPRLTAAARSWETDARRQGSEKSSQTIGLLSTPQNC